jgi:outer membrane protein TolC
MIKKLMFFCISTSTIFAADTQISELKAELLNLERQQIMEEMSVQENSWISPLWLSGSINKNYDNSINLDSGSRNVDISWSQDLYRSGGITSSIEQARASGESNLLGIDREEANYLKQIFTLKAKIERDSLKLKQTGLTLKNRDIDLMIIMNQYKAGTKDITDLNRATLDKESVRTTLIENKNLLQNQKYELKKFISGRKSETVLIPSIPLVGKEEYLRNHLELIQYDAQATSDNARYKTTKASFMPKLTFNSSVGYRDYNGDRIGVDGENYNYGLTLSMPLDWNEKATNKSSRLQYLKTKTAALDRKADLEKVYDSSMATIDSIKERIVVAKEMVKQYQELYSMTKEQVRAGFKSTYDLESLGNSVEIQKLEQKIQNYNILIEKISLYFDTKL